MHTNSDIAASPNQSPRTRQLHFDFESQQRREAETTPVLPNHQDSSSFRRGAEARTGQKFRIVLQKHDLLDRRLIDAEDDATHRPLPDDDAARLGGHDVSSSGRGNKKFNVVNVTQRHQVDFTKTVRLLSFGSDLGLGDNGAQYVVGQLVQQFPCQDVPDSDAATSDSDG